MPAVVALQFAFGIQMTRNYFKRKEHARLSGNTDNSGFLGATGLTTIFNALTQTTTTLCANGQCFTIYSNTISSNLAAFGCSVTSINTYLIPLCCCRSMLKEVADMGLTMVLTPSQSVIIKGVAPGQKAAVEAVVRKHQVKMVEEIDPLTRLSIACPALPMCGLAITEAERAMPNFVDRARVLLDKHGLSGEEIMMRMTGCPNGCARPYMAELAFVGDGPKSYQLWVGGSPVLEGRTGFVLKDRVPTDKWEGVVEPLLLAFKAGRNGPTEAFGDYCNRVGKDALLAAL